MPTLINQKISTEAYYLEIWRQISKEKLKELKMGLEKMR